MCSGIPAIINFLERLVRLRKGIQSSVESKSSSPHSGYEVVDAVQVATERIANSEAVKEMCKDALELELGSVHLAAAL